MVAKNFKDETPDSYVVRMLSGGQIIHYTSDEWMHRRSDDELTVEIFMTIKNQSVYKKLAGEREWMFANGQEIQRTLAPDWRSFAFYWLRRADIQGALTRLQDAGLIYKRMRSKAPYGYGDDEQYWLDKIGLALIEGNSTDVIREGVKNILADARRKAYKLELTEDS